MLNKNLLKPALIAIFILMLVSYMGINLQIFTVTSSTITITVTTKEPSYYIRQKITILGNLTSDGTPVDTALVAVEVKDPRGAPIYFRTVPIGNPSETWAVEVADFKLRDLSGTTLTKASIGSQVRVYVTIKNKLFNSIDVAVTVTICDETLLPIFSGYSKSTLSGQESSTSSWLLQIPEWTKPGKALVFINVYNNLPENYGFPYRPETTATFYIVRNLEAEPSYAPQIITFYSTAGKYEAYLSAPPDPYTVPGTYQIFVTGRLSPAVRVHGAGVFTLNSYPCPPQAAFTYYPLQVYQNMTVTFDASSSSAEGYNDTIVRYQWKINDPYNPRQITTTNPIITHVFEYPGTFTVELNVTDKEGLWSTTSKPIVVRPEFSPTANFTWTPIIPMINQTVTFDASLSKPGWSAATQQFSPIINYTWNFGDGTIISTDQPIITHKYTQNASYTVTLTVKDAAGRTNSTSKVIEVLNIAVKKCDVNGDNFIDIKDLYAVARSYGASPGDPRWDPRCDINDDGFIDVKDIYIVALHYGEDP